MPAKRNIDIRNQPRMGVVRSLVMTLHGIRYRLFRSAVTVMVIAVAVAFLMNVACESVVTERVAETARNQIADARLLVRWVSHLTLAPSGEDILRRLAGEDPAFVREVVRMTDGVGEADIARLEATARQAVTYLDFFERLDYGRARRLVHRARGTAIFDRLEDLSRRGEFEAVLAGMRDVRFPGELDTWHAFLNEWSVLRGTLARIRTGRERAIDDVSRALAGEPLAMALSDAGGAFEETIRAAGFDLAPAEAAELARRVGRDRDARRVAESLTDPVIRGAVAAYIDALPADLDEATLWRLLEDAGRARWFRERLAAAGHPAAAFEPDYLVQLAREDRRIRSLLRAERQLGAGTVDRGMAGMSDRIAWLLLASVVVCMVGIANAMLMAVTERFREIATLKCLGALDGTIMIMFVLEASLLGVVGGLAGTVLGLAIGMGRMAARFRGLLWGSVPWEGLATAMGISLLLGIVLAAVASVYPSLKAARLAPMEAMRIE